MKRLLCATSLLLVLAVAGGLWASTVTVAPVADTWVAQSEPNAAGALDYMAFMGGAAGGVGYVRFDLSSLAGSTIESATLVLSVHGSIPKPPYRNDSVVGARFALYGLDNQPANTPQDWDEASFTSAGVGLEIDWTTGTVAAGLDLATDLDGDVNGVTETVLNSPAGNNYGLGTAIVVTGDPLAVFIQGRVADNGLVTFILKNDDANAGRAYGICTKEFADAVYHPRLELRLKDMITYVDATQGDEVVGPGNTVLATGEALATVPDASGTDNIWRARVFGNGGTIFESGGNYGETANPEDCPRLVTSFDVPEGFYQVYVYFWSDGSPWRIRASLINMPGPLPLLVANDGTGRTTVANAADFDPVPMLTEGNRTLWQACIGSTDLTTTIQAYIDDDPNHLTHNARTWYDGIGYKAVSKPVSIVWVSDNAKFGEAEPNTPGDQGFIDVLTAQGYRVDYKGQFDYVKDVTEYWRTLDPNKIAELEAADLVIISRNLSSGAYDDGNEPLEWNAVSTPILSMSGHVVRTGGKWGWINGTATSSYNMEGRFTVLDPNHPVFADVALDANNVVAALVSDLWYVDCVTGVVDAGNGQLLATRVGDGLLTIATWETGQVYFEGSGYTAGGPRMLFIAGTGQKNSVPDGYYNLTADGERMFLNSVAYLIEQGK